MAGIAPVGGGSPAAASAQAASNEPPQAQRLKAPSESHQAAAALSLIQTAIGNASYGDGFDVQV